MSRRPGAFGPFSISVDGEEQVRVGITSVIGLAENLLPVWDAFHDAFMEAEREQFTSSGGAGASGTWTPLDPSTIAGKGHDTILVDSGALLGSLTSEGAGHVYRPKRTSMEVGTSVTSDEGFPYPVAHQRGLGSNPARKVIDIGPEQEMALFGEALHDTAEQFGMAWSQGGGVMR